jgi:AcrR family transcriptional regulator
VTAEPAAQDPRPGRPRSARADWAIRVATLEALLEHGFAGMSIEGIATAAGVAKTTIYRRFRSKAELLEDALLAVQHPPPDPDTGSLEGDLMAAVAEEFSPEHVNRAPLLLPQLMGEAARDPELHALITRVLVEPRRVVARKTVGRAVERGELRDDVDVDDLIDAVVGPVFFRLLITAGDPNLAGFPERVVELVLRGALRRDELRH